MGAEAVIIKEILIGEEEERELEQALEEVGGNNKWERTEGCFEGRSMSEITIIATKRVRKQIDNLPKIIKSKIDELLGVFK